MGWRALGDSAWLFEPGGSDSAERLGRVLGLRERLADLRIPGVTDIVSSFETVAVHFDPADGPTVLDWLLELPPVGTGISPAAARRFELPVQYGGKSTDLVAVARTMGLDPHQVIAMHCGVEYQVAAIGFSPGFPYLLGLDDRLALPRKTTPSAVPSGAVAMANGQGGVYPNASMGGWHVLGRTDTRLFDLGKPEPALLRPGDRVRFVPVGGIPPVVETRGTHHNDTGVEVIDPGLFSIIQDLGRPGHRAAGVSPGGAADPLAARVANRLVGNQDGAALFECFGSGPLLRFDADATVAWIGWAEGSGLPIAVAAGGILDLRSRMNHACGYLAVAGGVDVPLVLGSRSTDVRAGFGGVVGRALRKHDRIAIGSAAHPPPRRGDWRVGWPRAERTLEVRFIAGVQAAWFDEASRALFRRAIYQTSASGDRTGLRLKGPSLSPTGTRGLVSQPVAAGSIQVPPDGVPIVLMPECQTIGGYPQIGHVISADLPALARALPGTPVTFREVSLDEARAAWRDLWRELGFLTAGLSLLP
jgi:KipI family sensor histidine kinase inhibitor